MPAKASTIDHDCMPSAGGSEWQGRGRGEAGERVRRPEGLAWAIQEWTVVLLTGRSLAGPPPVSFSTVRLAVYHTHTQHALCNSGADSQGAQL